MAPPRRHVSNLGEAIRAARESLHFDQRALAQRIHVSVRLVSRWENGTRPSPDQALRILDALAPAPGPILLRLADALGIDCSDEDETVATVSLPPSPPPAPAPPPLPAPPPRATTAEMRAAFDAVIYAAAEDRDLLPRHVRAVAVELFQVAHRLGLDAHAAAQLVGMADRAEAVK